MCLDVPEEFKPLILAQGRIRVLCSGLDSKYVDAVPITQKVIEGVLYWDFHVRD